MLLNSELYISCEGLTIPSRIAGFSLCTDSNFHQFCLDRDWRGGAVVTSLVVPPERDVVVLGLKPVSF